MKEIRRLQNYKNCAIRLGFLFPPNTREVEGQASFDLLYIYAEGLVHMAGSHCGYPLRRDFRARAGLEGDQHGY